MNTTLRITILIGVLVYYGCIFYLLKKGSLALKYTILWLFSGVVMILFAAFPFLLQRIVHLLGIVELTNGLFAFVLFVLMIILVSITSIVSGLNEKLRKLVQQCAIYEKRIRILEEQLEKAENEGVR